MGTYVGETLAAVEAKGFQSSVTKHLDNLSVFLAVLLEGQLSALVVILLGTSSAVLAALLLLLCYHRMFRTQALAMRAMAGAGQHQHQQRQRTKFFL